MTVSFVYYFFEKYNCSIYFHDHIQMHICLSCCKFLLVRYQLVCKRVYIISTNKDVSKKEQRNQICCLSC